MSKLYIEHFLGSNINSYHDLGQYYYDLLLPIILLN